jgi:hypothetical protein
MADSLIAFCQDCGTVTGVWRAPHELIGQTVPRPPSGSYADISEHPDATGTVHQLSHGYCQECGERFGAEQLALVAAGRAERQAAYEARHAARAAAEMADSTAAGAPAAPGPGPDAGASGES